MNIGHSLNSHLSLNSLSILTSLSQLSLPPAHLESQSSSHPRQPTSKLNSHQPTPLTHATTNLARLPSSDPSLLLTQLADLSPKPQVPSRPTPTPSSLPIFKAQLCSSIILIEILSAISHHRPMQATPYHHLCVYVFLCCCWFCFGVIQKILNFFKFCLWLVIFDGLGWEKGLRIWVGIMQLFCLVNEKTNDILIIWLLIEIGFCWVKWY